MKCTSCDSARPMKAKNIKFDYSKKCGIGGCFITAKQYTCSNCNNTITDLGEVDEINRAIGEELAQAVMLDRFMIKYVRVHFFDESTFEFAKRIGVNPSIYSEVESFKRQITDVLSEAVKEQIIKRFLTQKMKPITIIVGNKNTKFKRD